MPPRRGWRRPKTRPTSSPGVDLSAEPDGIADILIDLAQRETRNFSSHFARIVVGELKSTTRLHKQPLKSAGFRVLKAPDVPSVLLELGYASNRSDLKLLTSDAWRHRAGDALVTRWTDFSRRGWRAARGPAQTEGAVPGNRCKSWTCGQKFNIKPRDEAYRIAVCAVRGRWHGALASNFAGCDPPGDRR